MNAAGLRPGQVWNVASSDKWQARIDAKGYAHCIGQTLAEHTDYWLMCQTGAGVVDRNRSWIDFDSAMDQARQHNAAIVAKRNAAQAGQGEG